MNPKKERVFEELQLKLGIKSSLPNVKSALGLLLSIWESGIQDDEIIYGREEGEKIIPIDLVLGRLSIFFGCDEERLSEKLLVNPLYTSQIEALQVAFELCWRVARFTFVDSTFPFSKERTGGKRYAKKLSFTKNIDLISLFLRQDVNSKDILFHWIMQTSVPKELEHKENCLKQFLTALSEECIFRIRTNEDGIYTFRNYGVYDALLDSFEVNISDAKEQVGTLRILNNIINDGLNYYFTKSSNGTVKLREGIVVSDLEKYSKRVQNYLALSEVKISITDTNPDENYSQDSINNAFVSLICGGQNKVIYGTPGCGKSYYVQNRYLNEIGVSEQNRIRTTFYQDYTNTDFVGQILPKVHEDKTVTYEFNPGPFALALKMAIENPDKPVALIIEELNRGNAASIFGDIFQLLDRDKNGRSQYAITNTNLQDYLNSCFEEELVVFNDIRIPANLYIVATMNTSDQNVFTLDTAFKRRWQFEKLRNQFTVEHEYQDYYVPGMQDVTWKQLVNAINSFIVTRSDDLSAEDKQLGVYFVGKEVLCERKEECTDKAKMKSFAYKVFEYLWDDVAKFAHPDWFGTEIKTLDQLIDAFVEEGKQVLANVLK